MARAFSTLLEPADVGVVASLSQRRRQMTTSLLRRSTGEPSQAIHDVPEGQGPGERGKSFSEDVGTPQVFNVRCGAGHQLLVGPVGDGRAGLVRRSRAAPWVADGDVGGATNRQVTVLGSFRMMGIPPLMRGA
jgi:hypothetical protein